MTCKEQQTQDDLVEALFKEDNEPFYKTAQHKSRSFNTLDTQISKNTTPKVFYKI
jgi:hypothetical protein